MADSTVERLKRAEFKELVEKLNLSAEQKKGIQDILERAGSYFEARATEAEAKEEHDERATQISQYFYGASDCCDAIHDIVDGVFKFNHGFESLWYYEDSMRDLHKILTELLTIIPDDETNAKIRIELKSVQQSAQFAAPEVMGHHWQTAASALQRAFSELTQDWQVRVAEVFTGRSP